MTCVDADKEKDMQELIAYADKENARKRRFFLFFSVKLASEQG